MKQLIICLMLIFSINKSQSQIVLDSYVFENGIVENRTYTCNKFDWKISFPEGTTITSLDRVNELEEKGYEAVKKEVSNGIQVKKNRPHLIGFSFSKYNCFIASFENLSGMVEMTFEEHQRFCSKLMEDTYAKIERLKVTQNVVYEKIGNHNFYIIEAKIFDNQSEKLLLTQILYNAFIDNNLFSVSINFNDEEKGKILIDNFKNSLSKK